MKSFFLFISMLILTSNTLFGRIKNGYESQIQTAEISLRGLNLLITDNKNLPAPEHRRIKSKINSLVEYITYFKLTQKLIDQFKIISPELFVAIDTLTDRKGRPVDIYIKLISLSQSTQPQPGETLFAQGLNDPDENCSEYGIGSVSVKIWPTDNAMFVLAHEMGHVHYITPRLSNYMVFYKKNYSLRDNQTGYRGHNAHDPSGESAQLFQKRFLYNYKTYLKNGGEQFKVALVLNRKTREAITNEGKNYYVAGYSDALTLEQRLP